MSITKDMLEQQVEALNNLLTASGIVKAYEIGYRYGNCYLDQSSLTNKGCTIRTIAVGTKKEISNVLYSMASVLR